MKRNNVSHRHITCDSILISKNLVTETDRKLGFSPKLCLHSLLSVKPNLAQDSLRGQKCFLSPEEFMTLVGFNGTGSSQVMDGKSKGYKSKKGRGKSEPKVDPFQSDLFSLGMVLLNVCTSGKYGDVYDWSNGQVNRNQLENIFHQLE